MNSDSASASVGSRESGTHNNESDDMPDIAISFDDFDFHNVVSLSLPDFNYEMDMLRGGSSKNGAVSASKLLSEVIPENALNVDDVETSIAKQMMNLSSSDREKVYMDVHGVKEVGPHETEEAINAGLDAMQLEIDKIEDKDAYELARSKDPHCVEDRFLRLAFLRTEFFDARNAAIKMVRHFQHKLDLFGREKLHMDIVQDDLESEAIDALYSGRAAQFLDTRDRAGRYILLIFFGDIFSKKAMLQRAFYLCMVSIRNPQKQIHGFVIVVFALFSFSPQRDTSKHWNFSKVLEGLPCRTEAVHFCHNGSIPEELFAVSKAALGPYLMTRTRTHAGTHDEIVSSLAQYGITPGSIPLAEGFRVTNVEEYEQHLRDLRVEERMKQPRRKRVGAPCKVDVLFGKGLPCQTHPGNIELRNLVAQWFKSYEKAAKGEKMKIAQELVDTIHQKSGLFLRPDGDDSWVCVEDDVARKKVSNLFRTLRVKVGGNK